MTVDKLDYKKEYKDLYVPKSTPTLIEVPPIKYIMIDGKGDPNEENGEYNLAVQLLYSLSYAIKMSKMGDNRPDGYFEYVVPPLEGLWWMKDDKFYYANKEDFYWTSMIRQPEFVTNEVFQWACSEVIKKKPELDVSKARLQVYSEGLSVQMMHIGCYDDEPKTIDQIEKYIENNNLNNAISKISSEGMIKRHHEIYLSDPRKVKADKLKTVIRHPVEKMD